MSSVGLGNPEELVDVADLTRSKTGSELDVMMASLKALVTCRYLYLHTEIAFGLLALDICRMPAAWY